MEPSRDPKTKGSAAPLYSRELTLQAHFTFGTPSVAPAAPHHTTSTSAATGPTPRVSSATATAAAASSTGPTEEWRWNGPGAECSITCDRQGLSMTYNAPTKSQPLSHSPQPSMGGAGTRESGRGVAGGDEVRGTVPPCSYCSSSAFVSSQAQPPPPAESHQTRGRPLEKMTAGSYSRPGFITPVPSIATTTTTPAATGRSFTFSGSLDRGAAGKPSGQRPYGRRCKSTAHIVLQNNENGTRGGQARPHEFHHTGRQDRRVDGVWTGGPSGAAAQTLPGSARIFARDQGRFPTHHEEPELTSAHRHAPAGGEDLHEPAPHAGHEARPPLRTCCLSPPCCPCHHCSTLFSLVSSLAQDRTCHLCSHLGQHYCAVCATAAEGAAAVLGPRAREVHPPAHAPSTRTFNSHSTYEEEGRAVGSHRKEHRVREPSSQVTPKHLLGPHSSRQRSRTPSPRLFRRMIHHEDTKQQQQQQKQQQPSHKQHHKQHRQQHKQHSSPPRTSSPTAVDRLVQRGDEAGGGKSGGGGGGPVPSRRVPRMGAAASGYMASAASATAGQVRSRG